MPTADGAPAAPGPGWAGRAFEVHLDNFEGPFDLLLGLIAKHKMDVTEVALSRVTDEFIAYIREAGATWDLAVATEFLVVAATLLDLKAARLLPSGAVEDEEDLALLEARDLLFARLLQYRAYKLAAAHLGGLERSQARRFARTAELEPRFAEVLPDVLVGIGLEQFRALAVQALTPRKTPVVEVGHLHVPRVSVREHAATLRSRLSAVGAASFRSLISDCTSTLEVVARFLALLDLYRDGAVAFDQMVPLGDLRVRWTGPADAGEVLYDADGDHEERMA
ncbi:MAG: segregation/condensation protein A [Actinomycetota bacterium]|nr:segregation/condensation protein A [Actinomycetota bacterium]